jgi:hypothetical protein
VPETQQLRPHSVPRTHLPRFERITPSEDDMPLLEHICSCSLRVVGNIAFEMCWSTEVYSSTDWARGLSDRSADVVDTVNHSEQSLLSPHRPQDYLKTRLAARTYSEEASFKASIVAQMNNNKHFLHMPA